MEGLPDFVIPTILSFFDIKNVHRGACISKEWEHCARKRLRDMKRESQQKRTQVQKFYLSLVCKRITKCCLELNEWEHHKVINLPFSVSIDRVFLLAYQSEHDIQLPEWEQLQLTLALLISALVFSSMLWTLITLEHTSQFTHVSSCSWGQFMWHFETKQYWPRMI